MTIKRVSYIVVGTLCGLLPLVSCGSEPNAATEANFRTAILAVHAKNNPYCVPVGNHGSMGLSSPTLQSGPFTDELRKAGLLEPTSNTITAKGLSILTKKENGLTGGYALIGCVADGVKIVEILDWTEGTAGIYSYTAVSYTMLPSKMASWVTPGILKFLDGVDKKPVPGEMPLQKTGRGWRELR